MKFLFGKSFKTQYLSYLKPAPQFPAQPQMCGTTNINKALRECHVPFPGKATNVAFINRGVFPIRTCTLDLLGITLGYQAINLRD